MFGSFDKVKAMQRPDPNIKNLVRLFLHNLEWEWVGAMMESRDGALCQVLPRLVVLIKQNPRQIGRIMAVME